jgi:flagellar biosynthetic protein FliQ
MNAAEVIDIAREAVLVMLKIGAPMMIAALVIGLAISILQALTQIQEMTLAFVPKIIVMCAVMILAMPFMLSSLALFTQELAGRIANVGAG